MSATERNTPTHANAPLNRQWLNAWGGTVRPWLWAGISAGLIAGLATVVQLGLMAWVIQSVVIDPVAQVADWAAPLAILLLAILVRALGQALQGISGAGAARHIRQQIRAALLAQWTRQGPVRLAGESSAVLASEWVEQVDALEGYYARFQPQLRLALIVPLLILLLVFALDWLAGLLLLAAAPLIPLFMVLVGMGAERLNQQHFASAARLAGHFLDRVRGLTTLQLFGQSDAAVQSVAMAADEYRRLNLRTLRLAFLSSAVLEFFASVAIAMVAIYVGFGLLGYIEFGPAAELTLFSGLFVLLLAPEFFQPLRSLSQHYHDRAAALGAADHLRKRLPLSPAETKNWPSLNLEVDGSDPMPAPPKTGDSLPGVPTPDGVNVQRDQKGDPDTATVAQHLRHHRAPALQASTQANRTPDRDASSIVVKDLAITYLGRGYLFKGLSFQLPEGQSLVLSGPSGAGKSSVLNVLAGFYPAAQGSVSVFAQKPGTLSTAWMNQRPFLIHGTWADNLRLTAPSATPAAMEQALHRVGLTEVLAQQPQGLDTPLGEGGRGLSGGQGHRLALARIFLTPVRLVLLDEPTAGLDPYSRQEVIAALGALTQTGVTLIMASHQPELIAMADHHLDLQSRSMSHA